METDDEKKKVVTEKLAYGKKKCYIKVRKSKSYSCN